MNSLFDRLGEWLKEALIESTMSSFDGMFNELNDKVADVAIQVGTPPVSWNTGVFSMIRSLSNTLVLPIAGIILTFVLCYELIQLVIEKNNLHDFDVFSIFKWLFKTYIAVYLLTNTFNIVMAVFDVAQHIIAGSSGFISGSLNATVALTNLRSMLEAMEWYELFALSLESFIISFALKVISICIFVIAHGRMLEIYLTVSVAPIPFATMVNREWGQIGNNYLKSLFAVAFQGFLIMICIGIYAVLLGSIPTAANVHAAIWTLLGYTVLLCFAMFKTGSLSKSIFNAH
jgi:hypothetical protein